MDDKLWNKENTLYLINKVNEYDYDFSNNVKKHVWQKVAKACSLALKREVNEKVCESKWKSLKRTYKSITINNNTSGQKRKYWEYYEPMHNIMYSKPEINPVATCSSLSGLSTSKNKEG